MLAGVVLVPDVIGKRTHIWTQGQRQQRHACHLFESDGIFYCIERVVAPREGSVARGEHGRHLARAGLAYGLDEDMPGGFLISVADLGLGELAGHRHGER